ncbi:MAG: hypothetical protein SR2Q5_01460 [Quinella sp. 2Q5]|nr:hypothetical protein [Quinella sp. 2Q5]
MARLEARVSDLERNVDRVMTKLDMFIEESREAREKLDADLREARGKHDADMRDMRERHDNDMREMRQSIDGMGKHVRNMSIVTIIGIAAMVVAVFLK